MKQKNIPRTLIEDAATDTSEALPGDAYGSLFTCDALEAKE